MLISVVIPTYNSSAFIRRTIESVYAQTLLPDQLVVADDASPDGTANLAVDLAKNSPFPVRVIRLPRNTGGPAGPLNAGIAVARGSLIATLDHDDQMHPDKLRLQAAAFASDADLGAVFHRVEPVGLDHPADLDGYLRAVADTLAAAPTAGVADWGWRIGRCDAHRLLARNNYTVSCSTMMFPKQVWRAVGGFEPWFRAACDYAFIERVTRRWHVGVIDAPLVRWHRHPVSLTNAMGASRSAVECWRVAGRVARRSGDAAATARFDEQTESLLGTAYRHRTRRQSGAALRLYWTILRRRPTLRTALAAMKCVLPARHAAENDLLDGSRTR